MKIKYMKKAVNRRKLRAYDEAIRKAKIALDCCDSASTETKNTIYNIFPELEDERIREEIIDYLKQKYSDPNAIKHDYDKWIVWLEKQGDKDKLIKELGEYKVKYTQEVLEKHLNNMNNKDNERLRKTTIAFLKEFADKGYENAVECIDWLEKRGMQ